MDEEKLDAVRAHLFVLTAAIEALFATHPDPALLREVFEQSSSRGLNLFAKCGASAGAKMSAHKILTGMLGTIQSLEKERAHKNH